MRAGGTAGASLALSIGAGLGVVFLGLQVLVWVGVWRAGLVPSGGPMRRSSTP